MNGNGVGNWNLKGNFYKTNDSKVKWVIVHFRGFDFNGFVNKFYQMT